jgi:PAS domain S-box-containing protein
MADPVNRLKIVPTGRERTFARDDIIVSKTDLTGKITYANEVFIRISGYTEEELLGAPHSLVRHPDMPHAVFALLWDTIQAGQEVFAYVKNLAKNGDHYWVFAHVTPSFGQGGNVVGYHSNRRLPSKQAIQDVEGLYKMLLLEEQRHSDVKSAVRAGAARLTDFLTKQGLDYAELMFTLEPEST